MCWRLMVSQVAVLTKFCAVSASSCRSDVRPRSAQSWHCMPASPSHPSGPLNTAQPAAAGLKPAGQSTAIRGGLRVMAAAGAISTLQVVHRGSRLADTASATCRQDQHRCCRQYRQDQQRQCRTACSNAGAAGRFGWWWWICKAAH
jgi:hypothetical protein